MTRASRARFDYFDEPTPAMLHTRLRAPDGNTVAELPLLLSWLHEKTGLPIICDDFSASSETPYTWLLSDQPSYSLEECLREVARTYGHHFAYFSALVAGRSVNPGRDLLDEPPPALVGRVAAWKAGEAQIKLDDLLAMGLLSHAQWKWLWFRVSDIVHPGGRMWLAPNWNPVLMALFSSLTEAQRAEACSTAGLSPEAMTPQQQRLFLLASHLGIPGTAEPGSTPQRAGLYAAIDQSGGYVHSIEITTLSDGPRQYLRRWALDAAPSPNR